MNTIKVHFDGGSIPPNSSSYGSYEVESDFGLKHKVSRMQFGQGTSNQAEYYSLIAALKWLRHQLADGNYQLLIYSDSKLVVMQVQGSWKCRVPHLKELKAEVLELLRPYKVSRLNWNSRIHNVERFGH